MIYAAVCPQHMRYCYRTPDLPDGQPPNPLLDFKPVNGQETPPESGKPATCDECGTQLKFVKLADEASYAQSPAPPLPSNGASPASHSASPRRAVAPPPAVTELFKAQPGEDVKDMRPVAGDRILIVTNQRVLVIDPNLVGEPA